MNTLFLINGKSGTGKTTVAKQLFSNLKNAALLDIDDLMRVKPWEYNEELLMLGLSNAGLLINNFFKLGNNTVILSGGVHEQNLVDELVSKLKEVKIVYAWLLADQDIRNKRRLERARDDADQEKHFDLIDSLIAEVDNIEVKSGRFVRIDTSLLSVEQVVEKIVGLQR